MALVLARLRLTIASRVRGRRIGAQWYFAASWAVAVVAGLITATLSAALVTGRGIGDSLLIGAFVAISLPWAVGPLVEPSLADGVVDPARLEQFPLTAGQQVIGLLAGALIAPTVLFTLLFSIGGALAIGTSATARLASVGVALAYTLLCVAASRTVQALLAGALRSRRGRDATAIGAALLVVGLYALAQSAQSAVETLSEQLTGPLGAVASWLPPGAAASAILDARDGNWADYWIRLSWVILAIALNLIGWALILRNRVAGTDRGRWTSAKPGVAPTELPLIPWLLRSLASSPAQAAAAQQLRYFFFRSPRALQTLIIPPVIGVFVAHSSFATRGLIWQSAAFAAMSVISTSFNIFAYDGPGFGYLVGSGAKLSRVLIGKALAPLAFLVPLVCGFTVLAWGLGGFSEDPLPGVLAGLSVVVGGVGVGALSSVLNASDQSRIGNRQGAFLKVMAWFMGFFALIGIGGTIWWLLSLRLPAELTGLVVLALTAALSARLIRAAGRRLNADPEKLLAKLAPVY
ncbi:hypothetical protein ATK74_0723 [Propionicimonas paludicola]|uniref:ABC-2 type transport system permease protein n=1 Tax=Propionicimonas paludicola TaxID=185243 RepID=A0A2A9CPR8_9ACTN|nr:hypothetical protein [Propionicimonas paludicola]PFG16191.1 hypothetical protein ATK74_0723 [Propionicimonas paludicola]